MIRFYGRNNNNIIGGLLLTTLMGMSGAALAQVEAQPVDAQGETRWAVNFNDTDIQDVIKSIAGLTGKTFIIDPKVRGPIKVINSKPLNAKELYELFLASLDVHGFTAVESGNIVRIVMNRDARNLPIPTENSVKNKDDLYITQVIPLKNTSAAKILAALRPLVPQYGHLTTYEPSNALIITDTRANVARMNELVVQLDKIGVTHTDVIPLRYANSADVVAMLTQLEKPDPNRGMTTSPPVIVADKRTNAVVISGDDLTRQRLKLLVNDLDRPQSKNNNVRVIYLKYAKAEEVAKVLSGMLQSLGQAKPAEGAPANASTPAVQADEATNSVLITADVDTMDTMLSIIDNLDIRRAQVLVEAIIVEITGNNAKEIGIEWMYSSEDSGFGGFTSGGAMSKVGLPALSLLDDSSNSDALGSLATGINSVAAPVFGIGRLGSNVDFLSVLKLLQTTESSNILSTPSLLTTDNSEASILVGQQVPFVTGSFTGTNSGTTTGSTFTSPFNTVNREDVGIKLQVTPQINEGDSLILDIEQEISSVIGNTQNSPNGPTTSKREIKTQILAGDGQTVVLGGLIEDQVNKGDQRVPVLGSIPVLGHLFRSQSASKRKTNLLIFLKPTIIRSDEVLTGATAEKYRTIRDQQLEFQRSRGILQGKRDVPVLPEWEAQIQRYMEETQQSNAAPAVEAAGE